MEQKSISWETAKHLKKFAAYLLRREYNYLSGENDEEDLKRSVEGWFLAYCKTEGITTIELPSDTEN